MSKERLDRGSVSSTPQSSNLESTQRRNSTGKINPKDSPSQPLNEGKKLPIYLRASTSSCHDFCKYGKEHTFSAKARCPTFSKGTSSIASSAGNQEDMIKRLNLGSGRKESVKKGGLTDSASQRTKVSEKNVDAPVQETKAVTIHVSSALEETFSCDDLTTINSDSSTNCFKAGKNAHEEQTLEQSSLTNPFEQPEIIKVETTVAEKSSSSKELDSVKTKLGDSSPANNSLAPTKIQRNRQTDIHERKGFGSGSAKAAGISIQRRARPAVPTLKPSSPAKGMYGKITANKKGVKNLRSPLVKQEGQSCPTKASVPSKVQNDRYSYLKSKNSLDTRGSSLRGQRRVVVETDAGGSSLRVQQRAAVETSSEKVEEKTLYVIEPKQNSEASSGVLSKVATSQSGTSSMDFVCLSTSESPSYHGEVAENGNLSSEYHYIAENDDISSEDDDVIEPLDDKVEKKIARGGLEHSNEKDLAFAEMKFRRGKVVNLQSESNTPKKLRFRRGTMLNNSPDIKGKADRRSFARKEQSAEDSGKAGRKPSKIVLRHQDSQQKKGTKVLYNHVIEETASKLVETRKSKVKALVGAFETVISLQEGKVVPTL